MQVSRIRIQNVLGVDELEFEPGHVTVIQGANGLGKTSIIEAIKAAIGGGHDATLVRNGADAGQVVLVLDDGAKITKRIGTNGSEVRYDHPEFGKLAKPQSVIAGLVDLEAVNPVAFLTMPAKKRLEYLLEVCPIDVTPAEVATAIAPVELPAAVARSAAGLQLLEAARKHVYDNRTTINGSLREKRGAIEQLSGSLPSAADLRMDYQQEAAACDRALESLDVQRREQEDFIRAQQDSLVECARDDADTAAREAFGAIEEKRADLLARIEALKVELATTDGELKTARVEADARLAQRLQEIQQETDTRLAEVAEQYEPQIADARVRRASVIERSREIERHRNTASIVEGMRTEAERLDQLSAQMTAALGGLDELKTTKMSALPIAGVEITNGDLLVDGVSFDRVNRARQVEVAIELAKLRAGTLKLICCDNLECLDSETFAAFRERAEADDVQLIVTRVTDTELEIETT